MKKSAYILGLLVAMCSTITLAASENTASLQKEAQEYTVQEKIVLTLDREGYVTGDTIRFRGALLDAATGDTLRNFSRYLYLELINPFGETVSRVKIKERDGLFPGIIALDRDLPESRYTLAAYTMFMENIPTEYFYRRPLNIASVYGIHNRMDATLDGNTLTVSLTDKRTGSPVECRVLTVSSTSPEPLRTLHNRSSVSASIPKDEAVVKVSLDHYSKFIPLPTPAANRNIEFYPEGGSLVSGVVNTVAYRSQDSAGRWLDTEGYVETSGGERVADLRSGHSGYGVFYLNPEEGETYYAVVGDTRIPLPVASSENTALQVQNVRKDRLIINAAGDIPSGSRLVVERAGVPLLDRDATGFPLSLHRESFREGLLCIDLFGPSGESLSRRLVYNPSSSFFDGCRSGNDVSREMALLQQDLATYVDSIVYYGESVRHLPELDAMLIANRSERYRLPEELRYPVEIGGEISGVIKSRWKGKPIEGATINVIAPAINFGMMATTDAEGRFYINGFDWPDGTAFVCQALGKKGQQEHNFIVEANRFPDVGPLPLRSGLTREDPFEVILGDYEADAVMLDELVVTAQADDEETRKVMMRALGIRSLDENDFRERSITSYEEAISNIPQLTIRNGDIVGTRAAGINNPYPPVEIWIDGSRWEPTRYDSSTVSSAMRDRAHKTAKIMTGNILPGDVVDKVYSAQLSSLQELSSTLPFHDVATFEYVPPQLALTLSGSAAHNGGGIVITTKNGSTSDWADDLFKQVHRPMGYQQEPSAITPW